MVKQKKFQIPEQLLRSLDECSGGGYVLFAFNQDGIPEPFATFDSPTHSLAAIQYISNWVDAVKATNLEMTKNSMLIGQRKK